MIDFIDIHKSFGDKTVLNGVSIRVETGQVFFIVGQSGVGKSVLIKHLIGLLRPDSGQILLDEEDVTNLTEIEFYKVRMKCGMVFQHSTLFDSMSCLENVALPLRKHRRISKKKAHEVAMQRLREVRMEEFAGRFPAALGDGMRKRVAIARTLMLEPQYVLFDEPTTSLDPVSARRVDALIRELSDRLGVTSIVVSHDLSSIFTISDRIAMLYKGKVRLLGTQEEFRSSEDAIVQQFINGEAEGPIEI
jgi:phospholipid/cholesterol/gamma-HCH transport system ATP-binding protein